MREGSKLLSFLLILRKVNFKKVKIFKTTSQYTGPFLYEIGKLFPGSIEPLRH